jgi:AAA family ATP:ADP antiporter
VKSLIIKVLNARPDEVPSVKLMIYLGFFTGIFLATYDVAAPAIFLNYFQDETTLAQAFLVSGFVGIVSTYIYSFLQARIPYKALVYGFLGVMFVITTVVWMISAFIEQQAAVVFLGFVLALPFSYLSLLIFWGFFGRVFDLKQAKRIIGGIDTGQLVASILALFAIGFIIDRNWIEAVDLFLVSMIGIGGMLITAIRIKISTALQSQHVGSVKKRTVSVTKIFTGKYTGLMAGFVLISLVCVTFIDYSFLNVINVQWETEGEKATFLANFEATVVIFSFLFQTFVTDWVIENYGLRIALLINPFLAVILAVGAVFTGFALGYEPGPEINLIWFFIAIAASKLFVDSLKDALDGPSFKLYFLPINPMVKFDVSTKIEGFITALGGLVAGALLLLMNQLNLSLIYISIGVVPILLLWFFITNKMYTGYRTTLVSALEEGKAKRAEEASRAVAVETVEEIANLKLLEKTEPLRFEERITKLAETEDKEMKKYADRKISALDLHFEQRTKTPEGAREIRDLANQAADNDDMISISSDRLYNLAKSYEAKDRILAAKLLRSLVNDSNIFVLLELLRDPNYEARHQAILTSRKVKRSETWPLLIELLNNKTFTYEAASALIAAGQPVLPILDNAFHRSGQTQRVMLKIINIMDEIGGTEAHTMLWQKIDFPDRKIVRQILLALANKKHKATSKETIVLTDILTEEIGKALWNITAKTELSDTEYNNPLQNALDEEIVSSFDFIYMLLSIMYDSDSVELVKENVELGTIEGSAYAIELLDIFLDKDLKPKLFPLIDDISAKEKLDKLQVFYPRQLYEERDTYNYLLNRESSNVNRWTKACTLYAIAENKEFEIDDSIVAHMFNPDPLLSELATYITYRSKPAQYRSVLKRMWDKADTMDKIIHRVETNQPLVFDIVLHLRSLPEFKNFTGLLLSQIVSEMQLVRLKAGQTLDVSGHDDEIFIVQSGKLKTKVGSTTFSNPEDSNAIGVLFCNDEETSIITEAKEDAVLQSIQINTLFNILTNYPDLVKSFTAIVTQQYIKSEITT